MQPQAQSLPFGPTVTVTSAKTGELRQVKPRKRVRPTSAALYRVLREEGALSDGQAMVLRAVSAIKNATEHWPTGCEVLEWLHGRGEIDDKNPNHVKPRLNELAFGWFTTITKEINGQKVREKVHVECNVLVQGPKRKSQVSGISCITWEVRGRQ